MHYMCMFGLATKNTINVHFSSQIFYFPLAIRCVIPSLSSCEIDCCNHRTLCLVIAWVWASVAPLPPTHTPPPPACVPPPRPPYPRRLIVLIIGRCVWWLVECEQVNQGSTCVKCSNTSKPVRWGRHVHTDIIACSATLLECSDGDLSNLNEWVEVCTEYQYWVWQNGYW